jgi:hypothetical protein
MKQPINQNQNKNTTVIIASLLGVGLVILIALVIFFLRSVRAQQPVQVTEAPPTVFVPPLLVATPDCGSPTLTMGTTTFQIQVTQLAADGSVSVPADGAGIAYWVEGTDAILFFMLSPISENLALIPTLTAGSFAKIIWQNCNSATYTLSTPEPGSFGITYLPEQSTSGIRIYFQADSASDGFVVHGELTEEQIINIATPVIGSSEVQAEISLLETSPLPDEATIRVGISIQNYGQSAFTLSTTDVALIAQDGTPLTLIISEPALPKEIGAGSTEIIYFTFPRPISTIATLKIFEIEYELEGY